MAIYIKGGIRLLVKWMSQLVLLVEAKLPGHKGCKFAVLTITVGEICLLLSMYTLVYSKHATYHYV